MSGPAANASESVRRALIAGLAAQAAFAGVEGLSGPTSKAVLPQIIVDDPQATDWGSNGARGRELRTAMSIRVARGQVMRLPAMIAAAENVGEGLSGGIGSWRVASAVLVRSRCFDASDGTRAALIEHRIRVVEI